MGRSPARNGGWLFSRHRARDQFSKMDWREYVPVAAMYAGDGDKRRVEFGVTTRNGLHGLGALYERHDDWSFHSYCHLSGYAQAPRLDDNAMRIAFDLDGKGTGSGDVIDTEMVIHDSEVDMGKERLSQTVRGVTAFARRAVKQAEKQYPVGEWRYVAFARNWTGEWDGRAHVHLHNRAYPRGVSVRGISDMCAALGEPAIDEGLYSTKMLRFPRSPRHDDTDGTSRLSLCVHNVDLDERGRAWSRYMYGTSKGTCDLFVDFAVLRYFPGEQATVVARRTICQDDEMFEWREHMTQTLPALVEDVDLAAFVHANPVRKVLDPTKEDPRGPMNRRIRSWAPPRDWKVVVTDAGPLATGGVWRYPEIERRSVKFYTGTPRHNRELPSKSDATSLWVAEMDPCDYCTAQCSASGDEWKPVRCHCPTDHYDLAGWTMKVWVKVGDYGEFLPLRS